MGHPWLVWSAEHIGHRLTGTTHGAKAEVLADSLFRASGLAAVHYAPFRARAWQRDSVGLLLSAADSSFRPACVALAHSPVLASVRGGLLDVGNGLPEDLARSKEHIRGRIVLVNLGLVGAPKEASNLHRSEKTALAIEAGAAAVLFVNNVEGHVLLTGTASVNGDLISIPAACISSEDGALVRRWLAGGKEVVGALNMANESEVVTARNIVAEIQGSDLADEVVLVGGHLDCWDLATGATDNGLGSFSILDMARCLKNCDIKPRRTIRFVLFMGEEQGLLGSKALVEQYRASGELDRIRCMVNMDMTGHPQGFGVMGPSGWKEQIELINTGIRTVDSASFAGRTTTGAWLHSDHQPFMLAGVPVINPHSDLGSHVYGCYHSSCDDIHLVDPQAMLDNVRFVGMLLTALADADTLPAHFTDMALRDRLIQEGLEEKLRIGGDWRW
ncbi:MAG: M20/M25/M40 family metallo-hydrolase [Flavobacteriales bacterium]|nr:M20/M25/M40 family metallo-hydrolase [Flavobacteriales bacterium]